MAPKCLRLLFIATLLMTRTVSADAQTNAAAAPRGTDPIRYTVSFPAPHTHYMEVSAIVPTGGRADVELMMAVWTPGSYLSVSTHATSSASRRRAQAAARWRWRSQTRIAGG